MFAFSINVFLSPKGIVVGGASGLATALGTIFSLPVGMLIFAINLPLVIANAFVWGLRFTYRGTDGPGERCRRGAAAAQGTGLCAGEQRCR